MKINIESKDPIIRKAVSLFLNNYNSEDFFKRLETIKFFHHTNHDHLKVRETIKLFSINAVINVKSYKSFNPWSKAIAYAEKNSIYFNTRKESILLDRVETLMHEYLHLCGYSHDGNYVTPYNLRTVPYRVANIFKEHIKDILAVHP